MRVKHKTQGWFKFFCMINSRSDLLATTKKLETSIFIKQERRKRERRKIEIGRIRVES